MGEHADLIAQIVTYLNALGAFVWPNRTGAYKRGGVWIPYGKPGSGDIIGMLEDGRFITVECKIRKDRHRDKQKEFALLTEQHKGIYIICKSFEEFEVEYAKIK
jgi:hypothetical protein